jgi:hypothetical protein
MRLYFSQLNIKKKWCDVKDKICAMHTMGSIVVPLIHSSGPFCGAATLPKGGRTQKIKPIWMRLES